MNVVEIAQSLVSCPSVTNQTNQPVTELYARYLGELGFDCRTHEYADWHGTAKVYLEAKRAPRSTHAATEPGIGYFCHNDVVSAEGWSAAAGGPFDAVVADDRLWGRGSCDMKGSAACALAALAMIDPETQRAPIYFFVTGDEECGMRGAQLLAGQSPMYAEMVAGQAAALIGEPTELRVVNTHKGVCHLDVISHGVAAHSSTEEGINANWKMIPFLGYLEQIRQRCEQDERLRNRQFAPDTMSLNVVIENEPRASNITVGRSVCRIFLRPMPETPWAELRDEIVGQARELDLEVRVYEPLLPVYTPAERPLVQQTLKRVEQSQPDAVCFATDGCHFQDLQDVIVLGPGNIQQAHRPDEWIAVDQLHRATQLYADLFRQYAVGPSPEEMQSK